MMARAHAMSGAAAFLGIAPLATSLDFGQLMVGTALAAGAATLPDLDEPGSTVSRALGPVTQLLATGIRKVSGGHRELTHTALGAVVFGGIVALLSFASPYVCLFVLGVVIAVGAEALGVNLPGARYTEIVVRALIAFPLGTLAALWLPLPVIVTVVAAGCVVHCLGDWLTLSGVPFLAPFRKRDYAAKLFRTDSLVENGLVLPMLTLGALWLAALQAPTVGLPAPSLPGVPGADQVTGVLDDMRGVLLPFTDALAGAEGSTLGS